MTVDQLAAPGRTVAIARARRWRWAEIVFWLARLRGALPAARTAI